MKARITLANGQTIEVTGTPEEIAALGGPVKRDTFGSFSERDNKRGDDPSVDGPIVQPDEPLILDD